MRLLMSARALKLSDIAGLLFFHLRELDRMQLSDDGELAALLFSDYLKLCTQGLQAAIGLVRSG